MIEILSTSTISSVGNLLLSVVVENYIFLFLSPTFFQIHDAAGRRWGRRLLDMWGRAWHTVA